MNGFGGSAELEVSAWAAGSNADCQCGILGLIYFSGGAFRDLPEEERRVTPDRVLAFMGSIVSYDAVMTGFAGGKVWVLSDHTSREQKVERR